MAVNIYDHRQLRQHQWHHSDNTNMMAINLNYLKFIKKKSMSICQCKPVFDSTIMMSRPKKKTAVIHSF